MQCLIDISNWSDLQIFETSSVRLINDSSSQMSLRSFRFSQRRLWVTSETVILDFYTEACFGYMLIYLRAFKEFAKLVIWNKRKTFLNQLVHLRFSYVFVTLYFKDLNFLIYITQCKETFQKDQHHSHLYRENSRKIFHLKKYRKIFN